MSPPAEPQNPSEPSWIGCLIPIVAITVLLGFGTCVAVTGFVQNRRIGDFTESKPMKIESAAPKPGQMELVQAKLDLLEDAAKSGAAVEISFSAEDLNVLIASQPVLESFRGNTAVESIGPTGIVALKSQEMRKLGGGRRFLNGRFTFVPRESETNEWQLMLAGIESAGNEVPADFVEMFRNLHMFRFDDSQKRLQAVLKRISAVKLEENRLVVVIPAGKGASKD